MELRRLKYYVAVAEELHFRRAAERLYVTQPVVSEQIRKLEAELGVQLLSRNQQRVMLTEPGAMFLDDARRLLQHADRAEQTVRRARDGAKRRVRLGYGPDLLPPVIPQALARVNAADPQVDVQLQVDAARTLLQGLRDGRLDAVLVCLPAPVAGLRLTNVSEQDAVVAVPSAQAPHPAAFSLERLASAPLTLMARDVNPAFYDAAVAAFDNFGLCPILVESAATTLEQLLLEVTAGGGRALVATRVALNGTVLRPIQSGAPQARVALAIRDEEPSDALAALVNEIVVGARVARRQHLSAVA
jgi:DNA-binding transcriptional LysR family regulator